MAYVKRNFCINLFLVFSTLPLLMAQNPCSQIRNAQFVCVDCRTPAFCSQRDGTWSTMTLGKCEGLMYCDEMARGCRFTQDCRKPPPPGWQFECQNPGVYPDPYDCKRYHECDARNERSSHVCDNGLGYSLGRRNCSLEKQSKECRQRQYECRRVGQAAAWPGEPNVYYVCVPKIIDGEFLLQPLLYRCPVDMVFADSQCVENPSVELDEPNESVGSGEPDEPAKCRSGSLVPVPGDCYAYRKCGNNGKPWTCPRGTHFNVDTESCTPGNC